MNPDITRDADIIYLEESSTNLRSTGSVTASDGTIYAGTQDTVYKSTDGGINWTQMTLGGVTRAFNNAAWIRGWFIDSQGYVYCSPFAPIGAASGTTDAGIWRSTDGSNFVKVLSIDSRQTIDQIAEDATLRGGDSFKRLYGIQYSDSSNVAYYDERIYRSTDAGTNWTSVQNDATLVHGHHIAVRPDTNHIYATIDKYSAFGPPYSSELDVSSIIKSANGGDTWTVAADGGTGVFSTSLPQFTGVYCDTGYCLYGTDDPEPNEFAIYKSTSDASMIKVYSHTTPLNAPKYNWTFAKNPATGRIFTALWGEGKILMSDDDGDNWQVIKEIESDTSIGFHWVGNFVNDKAILSYKMTVNPADVFSADVDWEKAMVLKDSNTTPSVIIAQNQNGVTRQNAHTHTQGDGALLLPTSLSATNSLTDNYVPTYDLATGKFTWAASGSGSPGGSDTQVQYNDSGSFAGESTFTWNATDDLLSIHTDGSATADRGVRLGQHNTGAQGVTFVARKSRGTNATPTAAASGDFIQVYDAQGYDGATYDTAARFAVQVDGTVSTGIVPTKMTFATQDTSGNFNTNLQINPDRTLTLAGYAGVGTRDFCVDADGNITLSGCPTSGGGLASTDIDTLAELNAIVADATLIDDGAIGDSTVIGLNDGSTYTSYGVLADDTLNELLAAIDTAIGDLGGGHDPVTISTDADNNLLSLSTQEIELDSQAANDIFAGPSAGAPSAPAFRSLVDDDIPDAITASNYLPLSGGTLTGEVIVDDLGLEFTAGDTLTDCSTFSATGGGMFYDDSEGKFKKCQDNVLTDLDTTGGGGSSTSRMIADFFADATGWSAFDSIALFEIISGRARFTGDVVRGGVQTITEANKVTVQWSMQFDNASEGDFRVYVQTPSSTGYTNNSYVILYSAGAANVRIGKYVDGAFTAIVTNTTFAYDTADHTYEFIVDGDADVLYWKQDGVILDGISDTTHASFAKTNILGATTSNATYVDNFIMTNY